MHSETELLGEAAGPDEPTSTLQVFQEFNSTLVVGWLCGLNEHKGLEHGRCIYRILLKKCTAPVP